LESILVSVLLNGVVIDSAYTDVNGIATLSGVTSGYYTLNLSLGHLPTGVYFLRIDGRESQAIKLLKMGRGVHPSDPVFSVTASSFPARATIGKSAGDEYSVRAVKDRYDVYEAALEQPLRSGVAVPLDRNNIVEFVGVDGDNNPGSGLFP